MGALLLALVAAMTSFVAEPDRAYAQAPSADATLSALTVVGSPTNQLSTSISFVAATNEYDLRIGFNDGGVVVTPTAATGIPTGQSQTIRVNGTVVASEANYNVAVAAGRTTTVNIEVTAPAGNKNTYKVNVYRNRQNLSDNNNLSSLGLAGISLSPAFSSGTMEYKARVQAEEVTLSYGLSDTAGGASAAITAPATGVDGMDVTLGAEATTTRITVQVTAEDASQEEYHIDVYRVRANPSTDATLSALALTPDSGSITGYNFAAATMMYDLTVENGIDYVTVAPTVNDAGARFVISPSADARPAAGHQVNLRAGVDTTVMVTVTAEDPSSVETYTLTIYKRRPATAINPALDDTTLSALSLSPAGTLMPAFKSGTTTYNAQVASDVEKVTVSYTPTNNLGGVGVVVANTTTVANVDGNEVTLEAAGATTVITLTVTAEDGTTSNSAAPYTINVYRLRALPSADATLSALAVTDAASGGSALTLSPTFAAGTRMYNATASFSVTNVTVAATATSAATGATVAISPATSPIALMAGAETEITVTVTGEDRVTTAEYTVVVYRERSSTSDDATLSALSLSDGMLMPAFMSDRMAYDARVGSDVGMVTVSSTPTDDAGGVMVTVTNGTDNEATAGTDCPTSGVGDEVTLGAGGTNTLIHACVTPENGEATDIKVYAITVYRENANRNIDADLTAFAISDVNVATGVSPSTGEACGPDGTRVACNLLENSMPIVNYLVRTVSIDTTASDALGAVVEIVSPADKNPSTARHDIDLAAGEVTEIEVMVTAEDPAVTKTYMASVYRRALSPSKDAMLSSLMLSGAPLMYMDDDDMEMTGFMSDVMAYTANAGMRRVTVSAMANHIAAQRGITITPADADPNMDGHQVDVGDVIDAETTVTVQVRPEAIHAATITGSNDCAVATVADRHADLECYMVTVTRVDAPDNPLLTRYDADQSGRIDDAELGNAIIDYLNEDLSPEDMGNVILLYLGG